MTRQPVTSSNIASVGYEDGNLEVEYRSGAVYRYPGVPAELHADLMKSPSKGKYFAKHVRGRHEGKRLDG